MSSQRIASSVRDNRETWLRNAMHLLRPDYAKAGAPLHDKIRIAVGFPLGGFEKIAGQCFRRVVSSDRHNEIFISPLIGKAVPALGTLMHELIHAADDCESGHGPDFAAVATALGLEGKPTQAGDGPLFKRRYTDLLERLGEYPHASLRPGKIKRQGTRLLRCECPDCGYLVRVTRKWIVSAGTPICPTDGIPLDCADAEYDEGEDA